MAYIGREPQIGNFQVCDAISVVNNQAAYTMQVSSVNVIPETANHMLVSLNGILQAPTTSYTVSGATITFASNLVTGDVINFIQILGSVLDLGVPSDDTVTLAKLASGTDGNIISYDTSGNPVAVATGNDGQVLTSAGAGAIPTFETLPGGGITEADMFRLSANVSDDANPISANLERVDDATFAKIGSGMSLSSGIFTFPSTGLYLIQFKPMFFFDGGADSNVNGLIQGTPDNSTYDTLATSECGGDQGYNKKKEGLAEAFFNCTNVSTHKIRFKTESMASNSLLGVTDYNKTFFVFIRLGDSQ